MGPAHWKLHVVSNGRCSSIDPLESYGSLMMDTLFWDSSSMVLFTPIIKL